MNKEEQVSNIIKKLQRNKPSKVFKKVSEDLDSGMKCVLIFLKNSKTKVYASTISDEMKISRTRIGILLDKMITKGLISKNNNESDARVFDITLTPKGLKECDEISSEIKRYISNIIDEIGYDAFVEFIDTANKIKSVLEKGGYLD